MPASRWPRAGARGYYRHVVRRIRRGGTACSRGRSPGGGISNTVLLSSRPNRVAGLYRALGTRTAFTARLVQHASLTKVWFELETLQKLTHHQQIIGIKDSSGDLSYFASLMTLREQRPDWSIMIGPEAMLPQAMALGGDGGVTGGANPFPKLFVESYAACLSGDAQRIATVQAQVEKLQGIYEIGKYASRFIKATKCACSLLGLCDDFMAEPFHRFKAPERARVQAIIEGLTNHGTSH